MASSIADFLALARQEVKLPHSKLVVEIEIIDCLAFLGVGELPIPATATELAINGDGPDTQAISAGVRRLQVSRAYADRAIVMGCVNPRVSDRPEDKNRQDVLHISRFSLPDRMFLGNKILEISGLSMELAEQVQSFREDPERPADPSPGGTLPQAPS
jgi:hypothetical protein